ncbi:HAD family hydrolase [Comamonas terrigena]|uniref:HAD family hydrolase n=1 Tax=Comamonas terrigena TaxID=32013 RepID=UPI0028B0DCDE|nr:HAD-IA family hydrolase [Comamonas terrigena]
MKALYILEPAIELGNPEFRFATLRSSLIHQIKALRSNGVQTHLLAGEAVANRAMQEGYLEDLNSVSTVDHFEWTQGENSFERSIRHQSENFKDGEIERLHRIIFSKLPKDFFPDIIFVWEAPMYFLEKIFPGAKVIYQMPGFFSRAPFPEFVKFDVGLLDKSTDAAFTLNKLEHVDTALDKIRLLDRKFFQSLNLVEPLISDFKHKFQGVLLLPLQIDHYFMVNYLLQRKSQFDIVLEILHKTPKNIGVLVTNYWSGKLRSSVLSEENVRYLRDKFENFIYIEKFDTIQSVSQQILPLIDGVYTISSSVGYQAAYWGKPVFSVGASHITKYNTANSLEDFLLQVAKNINFYQDDLIKSDLLGSNFPSEWIKERPKKFTQWIENFINPKKTTPWTSDAQFFEDFTALRREQAYLRNSGFEKSFNGVHTLTYCANLSDQIDRHEIISFDIFDTLLFRPFKRPSDLFDFMSDDVARLICRNDLNFKDVRRQSENLAFEAALGRGEGETHIDEIYENFQSLTGCSLKEAEQVKALEMQLEYDLLYERKSAKTAFHQAVSMGKRVIVISDMYLPRDFLEKILHKNGYQGYERIFVSSEIKQKKHSGRLFDYVLAELDVPAATILHVGDNLQADVLKAKERGIKPFHLVKALEVFEKTDAYKSIWSRDEERLSLDAQMLIALAGNTLQDNPYLPSDQKSLFGGDAWRLGYYGFGMFLLGYVKWIIEQAIRDKMNRLYFLSRDGLIMKKAYDLLAKNYPDAPKSHYLLCSRRAVNLAKIKDESGIIDLLNVDYAQTSMRHLLNARFGLRDSDVDAAVLKHHGLTLESRVNSKHRALIKEILLEHKLKIFNVAQRERDNYLQYLESENIFKNGDIAIVDIGYAGTMQESLYELTDRRKPIQGYYLMTFRQALQRVEGKGLFAKAYLANFVDRHDTFHPFCRFVPLYETLFSNTETTFLKMEKDWNGNLKPVHMNRFPQEETRENVVSRVHAGALQFTDVFSSVFGKWLHKVDIEPNKSMRVLESYFSQPHSADAQIMCGVVFEDAYGGAGLKIILSEVGDIKTKIVWSNGREALMNNLQEPGYSNGLVAFKKPIDEFEGTKQIHFEKRILDAFIKKFTSSKKYKKFLANPDVFFGDSQKFSARFVRKIYFLRG